MFKNALGGNGHKKHHPNRKDEFDERFIVTLALLVASCMCLSGLLYVLLG